ncbi:hypothetical protein MRB53_002042 [Persea americana]|uniref:Uncharacterized protein n=1 Tax=Persea americana TaxID=3435 RepID=A0ACC2MV01_PERAE|nr:hypothetical protein MRB53_002042 [Persea americana]
MPTPSVPNNRKLPGIPASAAIASQVPNADFPISPQAPRHVPQSIAQMEVVDDAVASQTCVCPQGHSSPSSPIACASANTIFTLFVRE